MPTGYDFEEVFSPKPDGHGLHDLMRFPIVIHKDADSDSFAARDGETRSGLLAHAALECVAARDER